MSLKKKTFQVFIFNLVEKTKTKKAIKDSRTLHYRRAFKFNSWKKLWEQPYHFVWLLEGSVWRFWQVPFYFGKAPWSHVWHGHQFNVDQNLSSPRRPRLYIYIRKVQSPNHVANFWPNFKKLVVIWSPRNN